jgi:hypothetical protein
MSTWNTPSRVDGRRASSKGNEEAVPHVLEDPASAGLDRFPQEMFVALQRAGHSGGVALPHLGAPLDVGSQERDSAAGEIVHAGENSRRPANSLPVFSNRVVIGVSA